MKTFKRKKLSFFYCAFLIVAFVFLAVGLGTLGSVSSTGEAYELKVQQSGDAQEPNVIFKLSQLKTQGKDGSVQTTYLRLVDVYINVGVIYTEEGTNATLRLNRSSSATSFSSSTSYRYDAVFENFYPESEDGDGVVTDALFNWVAPFSIPEDGYKVASYPYYKLTAKTANMLINEIVFVGEKLKSSNGEGTGEYCVIPAEIYSATILTNEDTAAAKERAGALLDAYSYRWNDEATYYVNTPKLPSLAQSSFFRLGGEEVYSMTSVAEMRAGNSFTVNNGTVTGVYHGDTVYNSLGTSILAFGTLMFGMSPFGLRFFPMLAAFGTLVLGFFLVKQLFKSEKAGFAFALLFALSSYTLALGGLGTPLMIGVFFFMASLSGCYAFYNRGMKSASLRGTAPLILSGLFGAAAICVNGVYVIPMLAVIGLFAAGMVRQQKARRYRLDLAIAEAEAEEAQAPAQNAEQTEQQAEGSGKAKVAATLSEYRYKNTAAPAVFFAVLIIGTALLSLLFLLPVYFNYVKLYDNPASPTLNIFALMWKAFAGGFTGSNLTSSAWSIFSVLFCGTGDPYAVTAAFVNPIAFVAGIFGIVYAVYRIVVILKNKKFGKEERAALRGAVIPLAGLVVSLIVASFAKGALAFTLLAYLFAFMLAAECVRRLTELEGNAGKTARACCIAGIVLLAVCFVVFAVFVFSVPLPASFMAKV